MARSPYRSGPPRGRSIPRVKTPKPKPPPKKPPRVTRPPIPRRPAPDPLVGIFGPYESWINKQMVSERTKAAQQAANQQAVWQAYAKWYAENMPGRIQQVYGTAANQQVGFAKGFSDGMSMAQQQSASEANRIMGLAGAPEGQQIHPGSNAADVIYGIGGYLPGSTLSSQGAAFASASGIQSGALAAEGARNAAKILSESGERISDWQGKRAELQSKKAEARLKLREQRAKAKADALEAKIKAEKDAEMMAYRWASLDLRTKQAVLSDKRAAQRIYQAEKRLKLTAQNQTYNQWYKERSLQIRAQQAGKPSFRKLGDSIIAIYPDGKWNVVASASGKRKPKWSEKDKVRFRALAADFALAVEENNLSLPEALAAMRAEDFPAEFGLRELDQKFPNLGAALRAVGSSARVPRGLLRKLGKGNAAPSGGVAESNIIPASFKVTHPTTGLAGYGATDWFRPAGSVVGAPVTGRIVRVSGGPGTRGKGIYGWSVYVQGDDGSMFFLTHFGDIFVRPGQRVQRGQRLGTVADYGEADHIHVGRKGYV